MRIKTTRSILLMVIASVVLWGTEYTLVGYAVKTISPAWLVAIRMIIASFIITVYVRFKGEKLPPLKNKAWLWYGMMGMIGMTLPFYLIARGEMSIDSGLAAILVGITPLFTVVLAHFFVATERLNVLKSLGFIIGFFGTALLFIPKGFTWPQNFTGQAIDNWQAQLLLLLAALGYATTTILGKRAPQVPASVSANMMLIGAMLSATLGAAFTGAPNFMDNGIPPIKPLLATLALAVGATAFANIIYLRLIQLRGPSLIAKINYMVPIFSVFSGIVFLNEHFSLRSMIALSIILAGLVIVSYGESQGRAR